MPSGVYKRTEQNLKNMSLSQKGKTNVGKRNSPKTEFKKGQHPSSKTEYKKGNVPPYKKHPELASKGKEHYNWQGGKTPENSRIRRGIKYRLWREAVFARDSWTCQECNVKGGDLHAHHKKSFSQYPELRFAIDNGLTLCAVCHMETPNYKNKKQIGGT